VKAEGLERISSSTERVKAVKDMDRTVKIKGRKKGSRRDEKFSSLWKVKTEVIE